MELREGNFEFLDNYEGKRTGRQRLFPIATVLNGSALRRAHNLEGSGLNPYRVRTPAIAENQRNDGTRL